jgi:hypothetical protein
MNTGIDKLILTSTDFKVKDWGDPFWKQDQRQGDGKNSYKPEPEHFLFSDSKGDPYYHKKLFYNPTPEQKFGGSNVNITIGKIGLQMIWNPSKFERDPRTHIHPVSDMSILTERLQQTADWINKNLVDFDIDQMRIYRQDLCRNITTNAPVSSYQKSLSGLLNMSRCNTVNYPTGMRIGNKSQSLIFYDKIKELTGHKDHKKDKALVSDLTKNWGENLLRSELQMLNSESVHRYWKIKTVGQLKQTGLPFLQDQYRKIIKERLFKIRKLETGLIPYSDGVELIKRFVENERGWFNKFMSVTGSFIGIEQIYGSLDLFLMSAKEVFDENPSAGRMQMYRLQKNINTLLQQRSQLKLNTDGINQMYEELYRKICA